MLTVRTQHMQVIGALTAQARPRGSAPVHIPRQTLCELPQPQCLTPSLAGIGTALGAALMRSIEEIFDPGGGLQSTRFCRE